MWNFKTRLSFNMWDSSKKKEWYDYEYQKVIWGMADMKYMSTLEAWLAQSKIIWWIIINYLWL